MRKLAKLSKAGKMPRIEKSPESSKGSKDSGDRKAPILHRTLWYMGAKARVIAGYLSRAVEEEVPVGGTVVDLMSGTGVVAAFCADRRRVFANDVMQYAHVIARSLIEHDPSGKEAFLDSVRPRRDLLRAHDRNYAALAAMYRKPLAVERELLERFRSGEDGARWARDYRAFLETPGSIQGSAPARLRRGALYLDAARLLSEESLDRYRRDPRRRPACLVTAYYANVYFGLKQALVLDSLRAAIDDLGGRGALAERKRVHYLSALLHAASTSTSGTSHFAQPRHLRKATELAAMATRRLVDIFERFEACSRDILDTVRRTEHVPGNRCFASDFQSLIVDPGPAGRGERPPLPRFDFPGDIDLVYFDPPYTADNYSRFYHVLEVIARYDYPRLQRGRDGRVVRGRYPVLQSRFQSGFCRKTRVEDEFRRVIAATAGSRAALIISYAAPTGLLLKHFARRFPGSDPVERLEALCREYFGDVETRRLRMLHSGQGDSSLSVDELLVICRKPR